jgi:hypothetical protein
VPLRLARGKSFGSGAVAKAKAASSATKTVNQHLTQKSSANV